GGMGEVFRAYDRQRRAEVALKLLSQAGAAAIMRFKREFRALADISHRNLVALHELAVHEQHWFFTMELIDGVDIMEYVAQSSHSPCDPTRLRTVLVQLVSGLVALHRAGKVHRDIKPSNIMVTEKGRAVILDFGLVADRDESDAISGRHAVGTVAYMAPEQFRPGPASPATDYYAVGIIMYQALTGTLPFDGSLAQIIMNKHQGALRRPGELVTEIPADLDELCIDLLHRWPEKRPDGVAILRRLQQSQPTAPSQNWSEDSLAVFPDDGPASGYFVGRQAELNTLLSALDPDRLPATYIIRGRSGVGKSTLARRFLDRIPAAHLVLRSRCYERESVPFKGADGVITALARYLAEMPGDQARKLLPSSAALLVYPFPVLRIVEALSTGGRRHSSSVIETRNRVFSALRDLFTRVAAHRSLIVMIDDMQWAGADTWAMLAELMRAPAPHLLLVLLTRPKSDTASLDDTADIPFAAISGARHLIDLDRLSPTESTQLARELLLHHCAESGEIIESILIDRVAEQLAHESDGDPLFIGELARHATEVGTDITRQTRLEDALLARIRRLPTSAQRLLELITCAATPIPHRIVARAANCDFMEYTRTLTPLRATHLVDSSSLRPEDTVVHHHDRIRTAVTANLDDQHRQELHRALVAAFEEEGTFERSPELAVHHLAGAGDQ
ncbi:MAG: protein kinase, partial [Myxococcota bacterium]